MRRLAFVFLIIVLLVCDFPVVAAQLPCEHRQTVYSTDTLRSISKAWNVPAWDIRQANQAMMQRPNYPVFLGARLCIPASTGTQKVLPAWVLDQPPARLFARASGKTLTLDAYNFPVGSNWSVKVDGNKIARGKLKILKKSHAVATYRLPLNATRVCVKNQLTDFNYCTSVLYPRVK